MSQMQSAVTPDAVQNLASAGELNNSRANRDLGRQQMFQQKDLETQRLAQEGKQFNQSLDFQGQELQARQQMEQGRQQFEVQENEKRRVFDLELQKTNVQQQIQLEQRREQTQLKYQQAVLAARIAAAKGNMPALLAAQEAETKQLKLQTELGAAQMGHATLTAATAGNNEEIVSAAVQLDQSVETLSFLKEKIGNSAQEVAVREKAGRNSPRARAIAEAQNPDAERARDWYSGDETGGMSRGAAQDTLVGEVVKNFIPPLSRLLGYDDKKYDPDKDQGQLLEGAKRANMEFVGNTVEGAATAMGVRQEHVKYVSATMQRLVDLLDQSAFASAMGNQGSAEAADGANKSIKQKVMETVSELQRYGVTPDEADLLLGEMKSVGQGMRDAASERQSTRLQDGDDREWLWEEKFDQIRSGLMQTYSSAFRATVGPVGLDTLSQAKTVLSSILSQNLSYEKAAGMIQLAVDKGQVTQAQGERALALMTERGYQDRFTAKQQVLDTQEALNEQTMKAKTLRDQLSTSTVSMEAEQAALQDLADEGR